MTAGGTNRLATKQAGEPDHAGDPGGHSLWYSWTPSAAARRHHRLRLHPRGRHAARRLHRPAVDALTPVASNDDAPGRGKRTLQIQPRQQRGRIRSPRRHHLPDRGRRQGRQRRPLRARLRTGAGQRRLRRARCSAAACLLGSAVNKLATKQAGEPDHAGNPGGHSVWYSWTPASGGRSRSRPALLRRSRLRPGRLHRLGHGQPDARRHRHRRRPGGALHCQAAKPPSARPPGRPMGSPWTGNGSIGDFQLNREGVANDDFTQPMSLGADSCAPWLHSNRFATKQAESPPTRGTPAAPRSGSSGPRRSRPKSASTPAAAPSTPCSPSTQAPPR